MRYFLLILFLVVPAVLQAEVNIRWIPNLTSTDGSTITIDKYAFNCGPTSGNYDKVFEIPDGNATSYSAAFTVDGTKYCMLTAFTAYQLDGPGAPVFLRQSPPSNEVAFPVVNGGLPPGPNAPSFLTVP